MELDVDQEDEDDALAIGAVIAQLRQERGWTQPHLAARVGTTEWTIYRIERGATTLNDNGIRRLAAAFEMSSGELARHFERAFVEAERARRSAWPSLGNTREGRIAFAAGVVGLVGMLGFAIAAVLDEEKKPHAPSSSKPRVASK